MALIASERSLGKKDYEKACLAGYCPTKKEIEDENIANLSELLKGKSNKETLTNILEWQESNVDFWFERWPLLTTFAYSFFPLLILALVGIVIFLRNQTILWSLISFGLGLPVMALLIIIIMILVFRKVPLNKLKEALSTLCSNNISVDRLLKSRLWICRDYAKVTACLLRNLYPNNQVFFAVTFSHFATGIILDKPYIIDQKRPVLTAQKWYEYHCVRRNFSGRLIDFILYSILRQKKPYLQLLNSGNLKTTSIEKIVNLKVKQDTETDLQVIINRLEAQMLKPSKITTQESPRKSLQLEIKWRKGRICYEDDEIVNYSLARWFKSKIINEKIKKTQILGFSIIPDMNDRESLILKINYEPKIS